MQRGSLHLGYCTNVHPGEALADVERVLARDVAKVRDRVAPGAPFGLGLRLGDAAARALADPGARDRFAGRLADLGFYVFTVNGFPYGDFAAESVKRAVYRPDWTAPERVAYTARVAEAVAALPGPPGGGERTISTVAGGFRPDTASPEARARIARHLGEAATHLARLAERTGVAIRLCLEPEPWTTLETTAEVIAFWDAHLRSLGALARDHLGLCYDCCHQAVQFEPADAAIGALVDAEVPIGKIQVSSALHLDRPDRPEARRALLAFAEPRYLHQTTARTLDGAVLRALDLPALADPDPAWVAAEAWRCHFHVPIWWGGDGVLGTTRGDWQAAVKAAVARGACAQLEVETYTWHVIPPAEQAALEGGDLHACVAAELAALAEVLPPEVGR